MFKNETLNSEPWNLITDILLSLMRIYGYKAEDPP